MVSALPRSASRAAAPCAKATESGVGRGGVRWGRVGDRVGRVGGVTFT